MRIGIDFDNTIVTYDDSFYTIARERSLVPADTVRSKQGVRDWLRAAGREEAWTELQGHVYGPGLERAEAFPGSLEFISRCIREGIEVSIISHKTRTPYLGSPVDLHDAATQWLVRNELFQSGLPRERVFFEITKEAKLARIASEGCSVFIDDLPELLDEPTFPPGVRRILFDPHGVHRGRNGLDVARSWYGIAEILLTT